ncbi:hypothetical protein COLO4_29972 [Corchorus olitorius]|uniref:Uncharacterized protein n=1 Tax=Corchorus olitorius TaxID=93759 RepID=A0A1R3HC24_9ROSI|nr:hypothetical protein COLO4_29972 [Corchorus olitorius]
MSARKTLATLSRSYTFFSTPTGEVLYSGEIY